VKVSGSETTFPEDLKRIGGAASVRISLAVSHPVRIRLRLPVTSRYARREKGLDQRV
jgi:hypothetical protein